MLILQLLCSPIGNRNLLSETKQNFKTERTPHRVAVCILPTECATLDSQTATTHSLSCRPTPLSFLPLPHLALLQARSLFVPFVLFFPRRPRRVDFERVTPLVGFARAGTRSGGFSIFRGFLGVEFQIYCIRGCLYDVRSPHKGGVAMKYN